MIAIPAICQHDATLDEIAALIDVTPRHARRLLDGVEKSGRGRWRLSAAIRGCLEKLADTPAGDTLTRERCRLVAAQATRAELELAKEKGAVALIAEFQRAWEHRFGVVRANMLNIPQRSVAQIVGSTDETHIKGVLRAEIVAALKQAAESELDPADMEKPKPEEDTENDD